MTTIEKMTLLEVIEKFEASWGFAKAAPENRIFGKLLRETRQKYFLKKEKIVTVKFFSAFMENFDSCGGYYWHEWEFDFPIWAKIEVPEMGGSYLVRQKKKNGREVVSFFWKK